MDIGKSFSYMFEDEDWLKKILIGGIISLVPILNFAALGYYLDAMKKVMGGQEIPLPEWEVGNHFMKGLFIFLAGLIYSIPMILVMVVGGILVALLGGQGEEAGAAAGLCITALYCVIFLYALVLMVIMPAASILYAHTGEFGAFFRFGEILTLIKAKLGSYIVALLVAIAAFIIAEIVGSIACGIGIFFTMFWAYLVMSYLFGQYYRSVSPQLV